MPLDVIERSVKALAVRTNYGLDTARIPNASAGAKVPVAWQIWRWEVKEEFREWLPKASREKVLARLGERKQVRYDFDGSCAGADRHFRSPRMSLRCSKAYRRPTNC